MTNRNSGILPVIVLALVIVGCDPEPKKYPRTGARQVQLEESRYDESSEGVGFRPSRASRAESKPKLARPNLYEGLTYEEACDRLGSHSDRLKASLTTPKGELTQYVWNLEEGREIRATFLNDALTEWDVYEPARIQATRRQGRQFSAPASTRWFEGGNLHNATFTEWKRADRANKVATASDWLASTLWRNDLNTLKDYDRIHIRARILADGIDELASVEGSGFVSAREMAASIITLSNDLGP